MSLVTGRRDARSLDHATLEEMRRLAISRINAGESQVDVARSLQVRPSSLWKWVDAYRRRGDEGLASTKATGRKPKLTEAQRKKLKRIIIGKNPLQLSFGSALWTLPIVSALIQREFGVVLHETSVARLLARLGLTPQKPQRRAFQRDDEACRRWASEEFPRIVREAKRKQATILFGDETGVREDGPIATTWGARGQRPTVRVSFTRARINVISFISPRGRLWFRCYKKELDSALFIEFLKALLRDVRGHIFLILDKHPAHVSAATRRFLEEKKDRLTLRLLPSYAPDMNPDEHVWSYLKSMFRRVPMDAGESLTSAVAESMDTIRKDRALVQKFFENPEVAYVKQAISW
ncbi:MAG: IS630 family transposase [Myxococcaceae bacterium]